MRLLARANDTDPCPGTNYTATKIAQSYLRSDTTYPCWCYLHTYSTPAGGGREALDWAFAAGITGCAALHIVAAVYARRENIQARSLVHRPRPGEQDFPPTCPGECTGGQEAPLTTLRNQRSARRFRSTCFAILTAAVVIGDGYIPSCSSWGRVLSPRGYAVIMVCAKVQAFVILCLAWLHDPRGRREHHRAHSVTAMLLTGGFITGSTCIGGLIGDAICGAIGDGGDECLHYGRSQVDATGTFLRILGFIFAWSVPLFMWCVAGLYIAAKDARHLWTHPIYAFDENEDVPLPDADNAPALGWRSSDDRRSSVRHEEGKHIVLKAGPGATAL